MDKNSFKNKKYNNKKIYIIIIAIIILIAAGLCILKITSSPKQKETNNNHVEKNIETKKDISVEYILDDKWQYNGKTAQKYLVKISNNSKEDISNWKIIFEVSENTTISQSWNVTLKSSNREINATPMDYNNIIKKDDKIEFGVILSSNDENAIKGYKLFLDEIEYSENIESPTETNTLNNTEDKSQKQIEKNIENLNTESNIQNNNIETPVEINGRLSVNGTKIVNKNGQNFIIQGVSTHGIAWFPQYINYETFKTLRDDFNVNTIRLAMYSDKNAGYNEKLHKKVSEGVEYAKKLGMYVIIDWHILNDNNPNQNKESAKKFFTEMANKYKNYENVLYEICNEPNGNVTWDKDIKPYAEEMIELIRKIDDKAIIIVGTPTWSQDIDIASQNPLKGYSNIVYTLHYYAATHKDDLRNKLKNALNNNLPVFVSEFGICDASGNGNIDEKEADKWISTLRENGIGYVCWNLSNKNESSAILKSTTNSISNWTNDELSQEGLWLKNTYSKK